MTTHLSFVIRYVAFLQLFVGSHAAAWVYPEHRDIALLAIHNLDSQHLATLDQLWAAARAGHDSRLCVVPADATQGEKLDCLDYAAWPGIAGDHSRSSADMINIVTKSSWILEVADITARLKNNLATSESRSELVNDLRTSDIQLQRADPEYATRAGTNNVHFLLPRQSPTTTGREYLLSCLTECGEINAIGTYAYYHLSALEKAARLFREQLDPPQRSALALALLADEAFAIHFLEDAFAAGHVAGTWGAASQRKGTHDYYNERGLDIVTWKGDHAVIVGDAYMRPDDAERAAEAIRISLMQVLDAVSGIGPTATASLTTEVSFLPDPFNITATNIHPPVQVDSITEGLFVETLRLTPVPGLATGLGEYPRFRAELGPFIGLAPAARGLTVGGGFENGQRTVGVVGTMEAAIRLGVGLEGVMNESGDGLVFLDLGVRLDGASTTKITDDPELAQYGDLTSAIPGRGAWMGRLRVPFWLIPGDLLITGPFLLFLSPETLTAMAVQAGNGGMIPWQSGIATPISRFQFVVGREVGVSLFGYSSEKLTLIIPYGTTGAVVSYRSIQFDFPLIEYRPFRSFSMDQSSGLVVQLIFGFDVPEVLSVKSPSDVPVPEFRTVWHTGLRVSFDWRSYF